jgi:hypothetical protein
LLGELRSFAVPAVFFVCLLLFSSQDARDCADVSSCRAAALEAAARRDYETFHDLAWRAVQRGRPSDPELMTLLARAQSLSGRPGDALVMLRRLAQMGITTDAATNDDFRRVRVLPGWSELEALLKNDSKSAITTAPDAPAPGSAPTGTSARASDAAPKVAPAAGSSLNEEPLPSTLATIQPAGLVYDAVSRRFIIGNRAENNLIIYDDVFKRAAGMVSAESAGFYALSAMEIDPHRGDLWVANSNTVRGAMLHKLQLVSGRVLFEVPFPAELGPVTLVDAAVRNDGQVLVLDAQGGRILAVSPTHRTVERIISIDIEQPRSLALTNGKVAFIAHRGGLLRVDLTNRTVVPVRGAPSGLVRIRATGSVIVGVQAKENALRLLRLRLDPAGAKIIRTEILDAAPSMPDPSGITVANGFVYYVTVTGGASAIRRVRATK